MGNSRKKNSGRGDMEFPAVTKKKKKCNFQELSENKLEFLKVAKKKNSVKFPGDLVFSLGIFKGSNTIL